MNRDCITHTISKNVKILSFQIATQSVGCVPTKEIIFCLTIHCYIALLMKHRQYQWLMMLSLLPNHAHLKFSTVKLGYSEVLGTIGFTLLYLCTFHKFVIIWISKWNYYFFVIRMFYCIFLTNGTQNHCTKHFIP